MPRLLGPWDVMYPVRFRSGGDTTRQAFGKHIQEIERIYGLLNALDAGKASSADIADSLKAHIDSSNPHPNWKPSLSFDDLSGALTFDKISGSLPFNRVTGDIDASRVVGLLSRAYIDAGHVNNLKPFLESWVKDLIKGVDSGGGITGGFNIGFETTFGSFPYTIPGNSSMTWKVTMWFTLQTYDTSHSGFPAPNYLYREVYLDKTYSGGTTLTLVKVIQDCDGKCTSTNSSKRDTFENAFVRTSKAELIEYTNKTPPWVTIHGTGGVGSTLAPVVKRIS